MDFYAVNGDVLRNVFTQAAADFNVQLNGILQVFDGFFIGVTLGMAPCKAGHDEMNIPSSSCSTTMVN